MTVTAAGLVLAWVVLILLAFAVAGLLRMVRDLQEAVASGRAMPAASLVGRAVVGLAGEATATLVIDPGCMLCGPMLEAFDKAAADSPQRQMRVVTHQVSPDWPEVTHVAVTADEALYRDLDVPWTPALLVTDAEGVITQAVPLDDPFELAQRLPASAQMTIPDTGRS